jgi:hypothetical protein
MDLILALKTASSVKAFVERGALEEALAAVDISAAEEAMRKVSLAGDRRGQVWSAINHLEGADEALRRVTSKRMLRYVDGMKVEDALAKRRYVLCLMAVCYQYLGETRLSGETLDRAADNTEFNRLPSPLEGLTNVPAFVVRVTKSRSDSIYDDIFPKVDVEEVRYLLGEMSSG